MKLANPLHYPLAVLAGGVVLFLGVRIMRLPNLVVVPIAGAISVAAAAGFKGREPTIVELENPQLDRELQRTRQRAEALTQQAIALQAEAQQVLTEVHQLELFGVVQYACDRSRELPAKIDQLARRLQGKDSLLSVEDLEKQLVEAQQKVRSSSGVAQEQWQKVATSLSRNIALAKQGKDAREAQVVSLSTLILDASGVLQKLQNTLRTADLTSAVATHELRALSDEFNNMQENMELLIAEG